MNANMDANGQRTPYFDGGLVKMNKAGVFPYISTRNNNFSNRNMMGAMCVAEGSKGKCGAGKSCQQRMEEELLANYKNEKADGSARNAELLEINEDPTLARASKLATLKQKQQKLADEIAAMEKEV